MRRDPLDSTLRDSSCSFFPAEASSRQTFEGAGVPMPPIPNTMFSPASYSMFSDSLVAAVDFSAGALKSPPCLGALEADMPRALPAKKKRRLLKVVGHHDVGTVEEHWELVEDPYLNKYARPEDTKLVISERPEDQKYPSPHETLCGNESVKQIVTKLSSMVRSRLRFRSDVRSDSIYELYTALPEPRMVHISANLRHRLLKLFGMPRKKESQSMLRYFALVGEVKDCGIALQRTEWNYALALATRYVGRTTETEVEYALLLWREMEKQAGVKGNNITFNILFDAASKAGNFQLGEMLWKEMKARKIRFNRYHRVSLIFFFGLQENADGVRAAYKEMVEAGEMVDTVALNCVIVSFLRCGEQEAALKVYNYMKGTGSKAAVNFPRKDYFKDQVVTKILFMFASVGRMVPELRPQLQELAGTAPDMRTYRILIKHFGVERGDLGRVAQFLDEMWQFEVPVDGSVFLAIFVAFEKHGGKAFSAWTPARLEKVLSALLRAIDYKTEGLYLDTWLMGWALRAFMKCANEVRAGEVYEEFQKRWDLPPDRARYMEGYVARILHRKS
ncbi:Pentatricopeptide repeat-containing protein, mitochondrial [Colletotrichum higginsianum]|nr:Pentatricopeptide repeat-containing protein, mitochondrial [Colletotrichum higginsianum]